MNSFLLFCLVLSLFNSGLGVRHFFLGRIFEKETLTPLLAEDGYTTKWFTQRLDHSDPTNHQTWQQRYLVNEQYFDKNERSVVFLSIGDESTANAAFILQGSWIEYAKRFNALAILVEHRFYGESQPTGDHTVESYQFFTSQQALDDLANIIQSLNSTFENPPQWIVFGCSYAGSLAAWLKLKYPHLVKGAVSTSGPLLAKIDFYEYYQVVAQDLKDINDECYKTVKEGFAQVEQFMESSAGRESLTTLFDLCSQLDDSMKNIFKFINSISSIFAYFAQYDNVRRNFTLDTVCNIITEKSRNKNPVNRLADLSKAILKLNKQECVEISYDKEIKDLKNTAHKINNDRAWFFQTCNEFGWYQSPHKADIFGTRNLVPFYIHLCKDVFGSSFNKTNLELNILRTNTIYGALSNVIEDVVYVHGSLDPWHKVGITESNNILAPAIFINGTTHCANDHPTSSNDLPQLTDAREKIKMLIKLWLE